MLYLPRRVLLFVFFFFNDTATTEIYTLSLHDALPISRPWKRSQLPRACRGRSAHCTGSAHGAQVVVRHLRGLHRTRSEEHTSELQSRSDLVCRLLLEKKKKKNKTHAVPVVGSQQHNTL